MTDIPAHHCPGCGAEQRAFPRYPWYFCQDCCNTACDGAGRAIGFGNMSLSGGFFWRYRDAPKGSEVECMGVVCLIRGRPVQVQEARFGGIVAEPSTSPPDTPRGYWRLTGKTPIPPAKRN